MRSTHIPTASRPNNAFFLAALITIALFAGACSRGSNSSEPGAQPPPQSAAEKQEKQQDSMQAMDADMKEVIDQLGALGGKPIETLSAEEARKQPTPADAVMAVKQKKGMSAEPEEVAKVENRNIPGGGGQIPIRIYWPKDQQGTAPVIVYYHGGGWVIANLDTYDASARGLANKTGAIVVSSHYRQAPEHKFPAAHEDAFAAYQWTLKNAVSLKGDPKRIAVAGESAGGNLAAAVSMMARDKKLQMPVHQLLVYPVANYAFDSESYKEQGQAKPLNAAMMRWFFDKYLGSPADGAKPWISLVRADNLKGLPPATVINAEIDPLRSEGEEYAKKLKDAGVDTEQKTYEGVTHEFFGMAPLVKDATDAQNLAASRLRESFTAKPK